MMIVFIGSFGFILLLIAYTLALFGKITQESCIFNVMNVLGALLIAYHAYKVDGFIITLLPVMWALVSLYYIIFRRPCEISAKKESKTKKAKK